MVMNNYNVGKSWEDRDNFKKVSGKFFPLEIDYSNDDNDNGASLETAGTNSVLPAEIQELVKMIFDIESMKKALIEFEVLFVCLSVCLFCLFLFLD